MSKPSGNLQERFNAEMRDFMDNTLFPSEHYPAKMDEYRVFALSFETPKSLNVSANYFIDLLANERTKFSMQQALTVITAMENRTMADYSRTTVGPLEGYCTFLQDLSAMTEAFNAIIQPEHKRLQAKYKSLSTIALSPKK